MRFLFERAAFCIQLFPSPASIAKHSSIACVIAVTMAAGAQGQHTAPTATRTAMLQVGGGFTLAKPDYTQRAFRGGSLYVTLDFSPHLGGEFMFHQEKTPETNKVGERTYELGPRYVWHLSHVEPFVKASYGRGVFNYPYDAANLAYNMVTATGGVDVLVQRHVSVRGQYEYQRWVNFMPHGLTPQLVTIGAAYRF